MRISYIAVAVALVGCAGAPSTGGGPVAKPTAGSGCPAVAKPAPLDQAAVIANSHAFFAALDGADVAAFEAATTATFFGFDSGRFFPREMLSKRLAARADKHQPAFTREWEDDEVTLGDSSAIFVGEAASHFTDADGKAMDEDGWYTLVWVPDGGGWKVAHYQWQKAGLEAEIDLWNGIYRAGNGFKTTANQLLVDTIKGRHPGTALDVGMGQGRNAIYLAEHGWKVTGIDIANEGIKIAQDAAAAKKLKLTTVEADMNTWDFGTKKWDLVAMIYEGSDHPLIEKAKASLKKGGVFVLEFFSDQSEMAPKMGLGGVKAGELAALFKDGYTIVRDEVVDDVADFGLTKDKLARFVAVKK